MNESTHDSEELGMPSAPPGRGFPEPSKDCEHIDAAEHPASRRWRAIFIADPILQANQTNTTPTYKPGPERPSWWATILVSPEEYEILKKGCPNAIFKSDGAEKQGGDEISVEASEWVSTTSTQHDSPV